MAQEDVVEESKPMDKKKKITLVVVAALLLAMGFYGIYSWWSGRHFRAAMAMVDENVNFEELSSDERRARFDAYRKIEKNLTKEQRGQIDEARERQFEKRDMQRMSTFFAMSPADQRKKMMDDIKAEEKRRQEFEKKRAEFMKKNPNAGQQRRPDGNGGNNNGAGPKGGNAGQGGQAQAQGKGGPGGGGNGGGPPQGGPPGGRGNTSPEARNKRASDRLDNSSPEYRAMRNEYRAMQNQIRAQMGLPANGGGRGGPPGGGGGQPQQGGGGRPRG